MGKNWGCFVHEVEWLKVKDKGNMVRLSKFWMELVVC